MPSKPTGRKRKRCPSNKTSGIVEELSLAKLAGVPAVNYLHQGEALDVWSELLPDGEGPALERDLLSHLRLRSSSAAASELETLIRSYLRLHSNVMLSELRQALRESAEWRKQFHALGCRGFSYE